MLFMHDVWLNWIDGAVKGYQVPEFFEWRKDDKVDLMDQIMLLKVKKGFFDYVEDGINELPADLIATTRQKSFVRKNHERKRVNSFVITDGERILAVDPGDTDAPMRKSKLIPRQEQLVFEMVEGVEPLKFEYTPIEGADDDLFNPPNAFMVGLTRTERDLKMLLFQGLVLSLSDKNLSKLRYWYSEWDHSSVDTISDHDFYELYERLIHEVSIGFHHGHRCLLEAIANSDAIIKLQYDSIIEGSKKVGR